MYLFSTFFYFNLGKEEADKSFSNLNTLLDKACEARKHGALVESKKREIKRVKETMDIESDSDKSTLQRLEKELAEITGKQLDEDDCKKKKEDVVVASASEKKVPVPPKSADDKASSSKDDKVAVSEEEVPKPDSTVAAPTENPSMEEKKDDEQVVKSTDEPVVPSTSMTPEISASSSSTKPEDNVVDETSKSVLSIPHDAKLDDEIIIVPTVAEKVSVPNDEKLKTVNEEDKPDDCAQS